MVSLLSDWEKQLMSSVVHSQWRCSFTSLPPRTDIFWGGGGGGGGGSTLSLSLTHTLKVILHYVLIRNILSQNDELKHEFRLYEVFH